MFSADRNEYEQDTVLGVATCERIIHDRLTITLPLLLHYAQSISYRPRPYDPRCSRYDSVTIRSSLDMPFNTSLTNSFVTRYGSLLIYEET